MLAVISFSVIAVNEPEAMQWMQPVIVMELQADISEEDAIDAMIAKAGELNLAVVDVHRAEYVTSVELCAPSIAEKILRHNPELAVYVPCRVSVINRKLMTIDFSNVLQTLPPDLKQLAYSVIERVGAIMDAGVAGEF